MVWDYIVQNSQGSRYLEYTMKDEELHDANKVVNDLNCN